MPRQKIEKVTSKGKNKIKLAEDELAANYNRFKNYGGKQYTGMAVGRSHKWYYDKGEWHETKITPDLWEVSYSVTKRRAGKAPKGSGVPAGTGYHWFILAHQNVHKLNLDDYTTSLNGLKYKLAHKRSEKKTWSATAPTQRKHLIEFLERIILQLKAEAVPLEFEYKNVSYKGDALPIIESCMNGKCFQYEITLNNETLGIIRALKSGWKMHAIDDAGLIRTIGKSIDAFTSPVVRKK
jgi:hypothetical protein